VVPDEEVEHEPLLRCTDGAFSETDIHELTTSILSQCVGRRECPIHPSAINASVMQFIPVATQGDLPFADALVRTPSVYSFFRLRLIQWISEQKRQAYFDTILSYLQGDVDNQLREQMVRQFRHLPADSKSGRFLAALRILERSDRSEWVRREAGEIRQVLEHPETCVFHPTAVPCGYLCASTGVVSGVAPPCLKSINVSKAKGQTDEPSPPPWDEY
jgi:hypothetical protein